MADHAVVMHPGPMNRGVEISDEVAGSARSMVTDQVTNGVSVRMAVLYLLLGPGRDALGDGAVLHDVGEEATEIVEESR
ncbi:MAG: hypothetical protein M5U19_04540 [Microthrixaceae bacterium]|nr:hypothetical protein [Microthrixaceae bacterium]